MDSDVVLRLARRYVWWQAPDQTRLDVPHLLCQIMSLATPEDYAAALQLWGADAFRAALESALPGAIDDRSWYFWRRHFGLPETAPPVRDFGEAKR